MSSILSFWVEGGQYLCVTLLICAFVLLMANVLHPRNDETVPAKNEESVAFQNESIVRGRYNKSFTAKLIQASYPTKSYYVRLVNAFLSYAKVRNRISWSNSSFSAGRVTLAKFAIKRKTLYLHFALQPEEFRNQKYPIVDRSSYKRYEQVPLCIKIKSKRSLKYEGELLTLVMERFHLEKQENPLFRFSESQFPYDTTENLIARRLIKVVVTKGRYSHGNPLVWEPFEESRAKKETSLTAIKNPGLEAKYQEKSGFYLKRGTRLGKREYKVPPGMLRSVENERKKGVRYGSEIRVPSFKEQAESRQKSQS